MSFLEEELRQKTRQASTNEVQRLLTYDFNVNAPDDESGVTALMYACYFGYSRIVSLFLQDPRILPNYYYPAHGNTPFLLACQEGQAEVVKLMMADPRVDVNLAQIQGCTPLFIASQNGKTEIVKLLLNDKERVEVDQPRDTGATPLLIACELGHADIAKLLLFDERTNVNFSGANGRTPLWLASQNGHLMILKLILATDKEINTSARDAQQGLTALDQAKISTHAAQAPWEQPEDVRRRYQNGAEIVRLLTEYERNPSKVRRQLQKEINYYESYLWDAAFEGNIEGVQKMLRQKEIDVNWAEEKFQRTPLFVACFYGRAEVVTLLLQDPRIDANLSGKDGITPFIATCQQGNLEIFEILLAHELVDINKPASNGLTPLFAILNAVQLTLFKVLFTSTKVINTKAMFKGQSVIEKVNSFSDVDISNLILDYESNLENRKKWLHMKTKNKILHLVQEEITEMDFKQILDDIETNENFVEGFRFQENKLTALKLKNLNQFAPYLVSLEIIDNPLENEGLKVVEALIKENKKLESIKILNCKIGTEGYLAFFRMLLWNLEHFITTLKLIEIDDVKLDKFDGLQKIPIEVQGQGTRAITRYILDLFRSPITIPLYRTKLMVVGYENVGKTTILDCIFPMTGRMKSQGQVKRTEYWFKLQGSHLTKYRSPDSVEPHKGKIHDIVAGDCDVSEIESHGIQLTFKKGQPELKLYCDDEDTKKHWLVRFKRLTKNAATHGIEITKHRIDHPVAREQLPTETYEMSVWDFAGQLDYYNNHHYFLTSRTVFLVLWKMHEGEKGLEGLNFWLRSLHVHIGNKAENENLFSIVVVGTHLDMLPEKERSQQVKRDEKIREIAQTLGLTCGIETFEVSCKELTNIETLRSAIFALPFTHSYFGETVPESYLVIEKHLKSLKHTKRLMPIIEISELMKNFKEQRLNFDEGLVRRALFLLSSWGVCTYFHNMEKLSSLVILDPHFLTKDVLAQLFNPATSTSITNGIIPHMNLHQIWPNYIDKAPTLIALLEYFETSFVLEDQKNDDEDKKVEVDFWQQKSVVPCLLPVERGLTIEGHWSNICRDKTEAVERIILFDVTPKELISKLLVKLHQYIYRESIWRYGALIFKDDAFSLLELDIQKNILIIKVRATNRTWCIEFLSQIIEYIEACCDTYQNLAWKQCVKSTHDSDGLVTIQQCLQAANNPAAGDLRCPITKLPLPPVELLFSAGIQIDFAVSGTNWWNDFSPNKENSSPNWKLYRSSPPSSDIFYTLTVVSDGKVKEGAPYEKLVELFKHFKAPIDKLKTAIMIHNPTLIDFFQKQREKVTKLHGEDPRNYKRDNWKQKSDVEQRKVIYDHLTNNLSNFTAGWNDGRQAFILPVIHGTNSHAARRICGVGFGVKAVSEKADSGFFGKGIYFSGSYEYAAKYSKNSYLGKVFVISCVIIGNAYPASEWPQLETQFQIAENQSIQKLDSSLHRTSSSSLNSLHSIGSNQSIHLSSNTLNQSHKKYAETLYGKACMKGYQSHYALVDKSTYYPFKGEIDPEKAVDEIVVFDKPETLPLFVVFLK